MNGTRNGLMFFFHIPNDISNAAITTNSIYRDYLRLTPLTTDTTLSNYSTIFKESFFHQFSKFNTKSKKSLIGTTNLTRQMFKHNHI